jgi:uncharacterized protein (DUF849 family)
MARGYDGRIGLEDGNDLPSGKKAVDNADIVHAAVMLARAY